MIHSPADLNPFDLNPLLSAIAALQSLSASNPNESQWLAGSKTILQALIANDTWLPNSHAQAHSQYYQQHALHIDAANRFSISSFVWGPGQGTPIHNHTIPGWVGVLRGSELCQRYSDDGLHKIGDELHLHIGDVDAVSVSSSDIGDVHTVRNGSADAISISIHIYRGNIADTPRSVFVGGVKKPFKSSYATPALV